jgi:hypothetical protein
MDGVDIENGELSRLCRCWYRFDLLLVAVQLAYILQWGGVWLRWRSGGGIDSVDDNAVTGRRRREFVDDDIDGLV